MRHHENDECCCGRDDRHHHHLYRHGACCCCCCCEGSHNLSCGCGGERPFRRRYRSREERIAALEAYLADLQGEAKGVEEEIARLRTQSAS